MRDGAENDRMTPARPGVGFKHAHFDAILSQPVGESPVAWFEVHAENYMGDGGPAHRALDAIRERAPLSVHGVGLSIGAERGLDPEHLARFKRVVDRWDPALVSEHLAWSTHDVGYLNDLLPLPYDSTTLDRVARHVSQVQDALGRPILLENPSSYLVFDGSTYAETDFLREVARRSGCGLLLDVNNVFVSAENIGWSAEAYLDAFPLEHVGEIHLAGHTVETDADGGRLLIDTHNRPIVDPVWTLYARAIDAAGPKPTLIEWDSDLPDWATLEAEAARADAILTNAIDAVRADAAT